MKINTKFKTRLNSVQKLKRSYSQSGLIRLPKIYSDSFVQNTERTLTYFRWQIHISQAINVTPSFLVYVLSFRQRKM